MATQESLNFFTDLKKELEEKIAKERRSRKWKISANAGGDCLRGMP
jgi:hypothetical protein